MFDLIDLEKKMYWKITPHDNAEYDCATMPANTEEDHRAELNYAKDRLEKLWDNAESNHPESVVVELVCRNIIDDCPNDKVVMCNPEPQIAAWIKNNKNQWEFWEEVLRRETWSGLNKTKEQVENLVGYFEGSYDMALKVRDFVNQKKIDI